MSGWIWLGLAIVVFLNEMYALASNTDKYMPLTYYVRKLIKRPMWWVGVFMFWSWLGVHFFMQH